MEKMKLDIGPSREILPASFFVRGPTTMTLPGTTILTGIFTKQKKVEMAVIKTPIKVNLNSP